MPFDVTICSTNFGPFDNGYLVIGLSNGVLLGLSVPSLNIVFEEKIFNNVPIDQIAFDPMQAIVLSSK